MALKFDLTKPPKHKLRKDYGGAKPMLLHPTYEVRAKFYQQILVPHGHAEYNGQFWDFSTEYLYALRHNLKFLQAWVKLIL